MAKKTQKLVPLTLNEIILRGDSETIRQALEARIQIDTLLEEREAAYQRIAELETQVCEIVGEDGTFPFPEPPMPVASFSATAVAKKKAAPKPSKPVAPKEDKEEPASQSEPEPASNEDDSAKPDAGSSDESPSADKA